MSQAFRAPQGYQGSQAIQRAQPQRRLRATPAFRVPQTSPLFPGSRQPHTRPRPRPRATPAFRAPQGSQAIQQAQPQHRPQENVKSNSVSDDDLPPSHTPFWNPAAPDKGKMRRISGSSDPGELAQRAKSPISYDEFDSNHPSEEDINTGSNST
ncbi:uncharacterized protein MELLADRAFT_86111 [Melampsora larici-populina 98AG31]|uniref:Uncharacterized protein n=1 Tax=Melampsora larici-populina (strain 98AG31 / pathotype 3-4-7) TaxID=747676 RepID=F4SDK2_MELLP|nr:uncharacterized protein MELLADRAFT_86111 [Melampsora larici-populina 98AG31]EGF97276.1 hypothetical protein MELLADRAFT_86111 [Melampsora larici-populina 98AG31]